MKALKITAVILASIAFVGSIGLNLYSFGQSALEKKYQEIANQTALSLLQQIGNSIDTNGEVDVVVPQTDGTGKNYKLVPKDL